MVSIAPRLSPRVLAAIERLDDEHVPIAETWRRVRLAAREMGLTEPSYERVRTIVHLRRRLRANRLSTTAVLTAVALRRLPPDALLDHVSGTR